MLETFNIKVLYKMYITFNIKVIYSQNKKFEHALMSSSVLGIGNVYSFSAI